MHYNENYFKLMTFKAFQCFQYKVWLSLKHEWNTKGIKIINYWKYASYESNWTVEWSFFIGTIFYWFILLIYSHYPIIHLNTMLHLESRQYVILKIQNCQVKFPFNVQLDFWNYFMRTQVEWWTNYNGKK